MRIHIPILLAGLALESPIANASAQSVPHSSFNGRRALLGAGVGAAAGAGLGLAVDGAIDGDQAVVVPIGAASGGLIGLIVGGRGRGAAKSAATGFVIGAIVGGGVGYVASATCNEASECDPASYSVAGGAGVGALLGATIGALTGGSGERDAALLLAPAQGRFTLGATLTF